MLLPWRSVAIWTAFGLAVVAALTLGTWLGVARVGVVWPESDAPLTDRVSMATLLVAYVTLLVAFAALGAAILAALYGYRQLRLLIGQQQDLAHQLAGHWLTIGFERTHVAPNGPSHEAILEAVPPREAGDQSGPVPRPLHFVLGNTGPGSADDVRVHLRIPPQVAAHVQWTDVRAESATRCWSESDGTWHLECSIGVLHPSEHTPLLAELHVDESTPVEFPITATLGMRNARPREHALHVRLTAPSLA